MKKLIVALSILSAVCFSRAADAAELCWNHYEGASYYVATFSNGDPNVKMSLSVESYVTVDGVARWDMPQGSTDELEAGTLTLTMHAQGVDAEGKPWVGRPVTVTPDDFDCNNVLTLPPPRVLFDLTCDGQRTVSDALALLRVALLIDPLPNCD